MADQPSSSGQISASEKFFRHFQNEVADLQSQINKLESYSTSGGERSDAIDHCLSGIARLSNEVNDVSSSIPARDQRVYADGIKALNTKLQDVRATFAPRPKFAFKSGLKFTARKNESAISLHDAAELASQSQQQITGQKSDFVASSDNTTTENTGDAEHQQYDHRKNDGDAQSTIGSANTQRSVNISKRETAYIALSAAEVSDGSSGAVTNITRCIVDISLPTTKGKPFAGLTLKNIANSLVICGRVDGAVHVTNVRDSVLVVLSRQFRMHGSSNCEVYLLTSSRPIIEDCSGIRFAPAPEKYLTEQDPRQNDAWSNVDDFKWLKSEPSPNWRILEPDKRIASTVWEEVASGQGQLEVANILQAFGIQA